MKKQGILRRWTGQFGFIHCYNESEGKEKETFFAHRSRFITDAEALKSGLHVLFTPGKPRFIGESPAAFEIEVIESTTASKEVQ